MLEDLNNIYNIEKKTMMPMLLQILATSAGSLINDAAIGRKIGLNSTTVRNYRTLLNATFITKTLNPWYRNTTKRLVKAKKIYFYDTMLLCHLLQQPLDSMPKYQPHVLVMCWKTLYCLSY